MKKLISYGLLLSLTLTAISPTLIYPVYPAYQQAQAQNGSFWDRAKARVATFFGFQSKQEAPVRPAPVQAPRPAVSPKAAPGQWEIDRQVAAFVQEQAEPQELHAFSDVRSFLMTAGMGACGADMAHMNRYAAYAPQAPDEEAVKEWAQKNNKDFEPLMKELQEKHAVDLARYDEGFKKAHGSRQAAAAAGAATALTQAAACVGAQKLSKVATGADYTSWAHPTIGALGVSTATAILTGKKKYLMSPSDVAESTVTDGLMLSTTFLASEVMKHNYGSDWKPVWQRDHSDSRLRDWGYWAVGGAITLGLLPVVRHFIHKCVVAPLADDIRWYFGYKTRAQQAVLYAKQAAQHAKRAAKKEQNFHELQAAQAYFTALEQDEFLKGKINALKKQIFEQLKQARAQGAKINFNSVETKLAIAEKINQALMADGDCRARIEALEHQRQQAQVGQQAQAPQQPAGAQQA